MRPDALKDQARLWIAEESVQVLRRHGRSDEEIRAILSDDLHIDKGTLDILLDTESEHDT